MRAPETKDFKFKVKVLKTADGDFGEFEGFASTFGNRDMVGDIIERGAFHRTLDKNESFPVLWNHNHDEPIGRMLSSEMRETKGGLSVRGKLSLGVERAREIRDLMLDGVLSGMSIGFQIPKGKVEFDANGVRRIKEVNLWEVSIVTFPANPQARLSGVKSIQDAYTQCIKALAQVRVDSTPQAKARAAESLERTLALLREDGAERSQLLADDPSLATAGPANPPSDPDVIASLRHISDQLKREFPACL